MGVGHRAGILPGASTHRHPGEDACATSRQGARVGLPGQVGSFRSRGMGFSISAFCELSEARFRDRWCRGPGWSIFSGMVGLVGTGIALALALGLGIVLVWAAGESWREEESTAAFRLGGAAVAVFLFCLLLLLLPEPWLTRLVALLAVLAVFLAVALLVPLQGEPIQDLGVPLPGVDERDIMFSRAELSPGSARFQEYYDARPQNRGPDDAFRREPGLLSREASQSHPLAFPAAAAAFWTVEQLRPCVEGGEPGPRAESPSELLDSAAVTRFLKAWTRKLGAHSVGVTELRDYHLYSHVGRGEAYGEAVSLHHTHALAFTVEMDKEMVDRAPRAPTVMESAHQYLRSGVMAIQLADLVRRLGFRARAHIDGNYRVICPLVARDAGLGEIGRMGLLMTPRLGPRVRIAVVTTDLTLAPDPPARDLSVLDFCSRCRKCAYACPSRAISVEGPEEDDRGVRRWRIDSEACYTLWTRMGTDCARCMAVCPYSHPDTPLHNVVRWGIRRNELFRRGALWMDDLLYGAAPTGKPLPEWMESSHAPDPAASLGTEREKGRFSGGAQGS